MSSNKRHRLTRRLRTLCAACQGRKSDSSTAVKCGRIGTTRCAWNGYRGEINRARARRRSELIASPPAVSPFGQPEVVEGRILNGGQLAHRQLMFDHFQGASRVAP
jgi:hypothetical protein